MKPLPSIHQLHKALQQRTLTYGELVEQCVRHMAQGKALNAFVRTYEAAAKERAEAMQQQLFEKPLKPLSGVVVGIKDMLCYQDHPVQAASRILEGFVSQFSATAVARLLQADAIILGHQNCDEFGMGSSNENSIFGPVRNAADTSRVAGGSSGGSAAAVQAHMCQVSLGTDTGGSVRQPAAFCGIIGLKPTYGRISRHGLIAYASSLDTIGILAQRVEDCAAVLEVIAGPDAYDSTVAQREVPDYSQQLHFSGRARVAYFKETLEHPGLQQEVRQQTLKKLEALRQAGHQVESVDFPLLPYLLPTYYVLANAEASSNLARFDGVRYGYRTPNPANLEDMYCKTRSEGFGPEVQRRILLGTFVLSASCQDAYYAKAQQVRTQIKTFFRELFMKYDFVLSPTTPTTAFELGAKQSNPLATYLADVYTVPASLAGIPAISIPNGKDGDQLPIGLQVMGGAFEEDKLMAFAAYLRQLA